MREAYAASIRNAGSQSITGAGGARRSRRVGASAALASFVTCLVTCAAGGAPSAAPDEVVLGPAPRSANGRFENFAGELSNAGVRIKLPFMLRRATSRFRTPSGLPRRASVSTAAIAANDSSGPPTVTWIGHSTLLVQMDGSSFLTDPIWSRRAGPGGVIGARRWDEPGRTLEALPPLDFVLVSHNHYDHLDLATLRTLAERHPAARFFVPQGNASLLRRNGIDDVVELDWGETRSFGGLRIHCLPAQHWSQRGLTDAMKTLWASWAVTGPRRRFYFAGDSGAFDGFERIGRALGPFDLAAVPIGAYQPEEMMRPSHLDPEEAVTAALDLRARRMLAIHWGTFDLADEPPGEPPLRFRAAASARGVADGDVWVFELGESREF